MILTLSGGSTWQRSLTLHGDKSLSHRSLIFGAMGRGVTEISGLSSGADVMSTASCLRALGAEVTIHGGGQASVTGSCPLACASK